MNFTIRSLAWVAFAGMNFSGLGWAQTTWHVDVSAEPPGIGSASSPYTSIQFAIDQPSTLSGDTLLVREGSYFEQVRYKGKALTIQAERGPTVTFLEDPPAASFGPAVLMDPSGGPSKVLDGFTIRTQFGGVWNSHFDGQVTRCILVGLASHSQVGIQMEENTDILHCTLSGWARGVGSSQFPYTCHSAVLWNSLFVDNSVDLQFTNTSCNSGYAYHCAFQKPQQGPWTVIGAVFGVPPGVWDLSTQDFHLKPLSPCIDAGDPSLPPDPDGSVADIGAIRYKPGYAATPTNYCAGKIHSGGCAPRVSWTGTPSLSGADDFVLTAGLALNGMMGNFIWGAVPKLTSFAGGNLCVGPPIVRGPVTSSGGSGAGSNCTGSFVWPVTHATMQQQGWAPGAILYAQSWGRDTGYSHPDNSQLSDAVVFQVVP